MVQVAMSFIDEAPDAEKKLALIETLRTVTEGKVWSDKQQDNREHRPDLEL